MKSGNFLWLLVAVLVFLIGVPLVDDGGITAKPVARAIMFAALLGIGVISLYGAGRVFYVAMFFAISGITLSISAAGTESNISSYASFFAILGFLLTATAFTSIRVARESEPSANRIVGAIVVYLLLGIIWAIAYTVVEFSSPGSFRGIEMADGARWGSEWLYFSFVTMTTLGFGDITPLTATARALTYMQAVFGQFYIAILVAGLVGAYVSHRQSEEAKQGGN